MQARSQDAAKSLDVGFTIKIRRAVFRYRDRTSLWGLRSALKLRVGILCTLCTVTVIPLALPRGIDPCFSLERAGRATPAAQHHVDEHASSPVAHHPRHQGCSCGTAPFRFRGPKLVARGASVHFLQKLAHCIELRAEAFPISGLQSLHCLIVAIKRFACLTCRRACDGPLLCRG